MRAFVIRVLKNGIPVTVLLALVGYAMSQMAEMLAGKPDRVTPEGVPNLVEHLKWRIPLGFAAWGFGLVVFFEALYSIWRKPVPPAPTPPTTPMPDTAEQLLLQLLAEAEAAERARAMPAPADPTPPPRGVLEAPAPVHLAESGLANTPK